MYEVAGCDVPCGNAAMDVNMCYGVTRLQIGNMRLGVSSVLACTNPFADAGVMILPGAVRNTQRSQGCNVRDVLRIHLNHGSCDCRSAT